MNGPTIVPVTVGTCTLDVKHSILREVRTGVAAITLHVVGGRITDGRELTREECDAMEDAYATMIEAALWEWYAAQHPELEDAPCNE